MQSTGKNKYINHVSIRNTWINACVTGDLGLEIRNQDIGDNIGLFYKGHGPNYYVVGKCAIRENRLYQVFILKDGGYPSEERVESFLGSFTLN